MHRVAHGKCFKVDSEMDIRGGYTVQYVVSSGIGSHTPCFSLDSVSALSVG